MKVYFVRHGQSQGNLAGIHQDGKVKLSPQGIEQAQELAKRFSHIDIDIILSSDYERAHHTAKIVAKSANHQIITTSLLREIKRPTEIEGRRVDEPEVLAIKNQIVQNRHDPEYRYSDEETFFDIASRANQFLSTLEKRTEQNILCVAHGDIIRNIILTILIGDNYSPAIYEIIRKTMATENTGISMCEYKDKQWRLLTWNDYAHLG